MRSKSFIIVFLAAAIMLLGVYIFLFEDNTLFQDLKTANTNYDSASSVDYEAQKVENNRLQGEIEFVQSEITVLNANLKNIAAEHSQKEIDLRLEKTQEISQQANSLRQQISELENKIQILEDQQYEDELYQESSSDLIYALLLDCTEDTAVDIVTYFADQSDKGYYTVKLVGYIDSLSEVMDNIIASGADYNISIGNMSLRQIYSCYDNMRPWDKATLLDWFKNQYVTGSGNIGSIEGGYVIDGIKLSGLIGQETINALKVAKQAAIDENKVKYDGIIAEIEKQRLQSIMEAYNGSADGITTDKIEALVASLNAYYDRRVADTRAECTEKEAQIAKNYDDRISALEKDFVDEEFNLADPDMLIYTLDITFKVHAE